MQGHSGLHTTALCSDVRSSLLFVHIYAVNIHAPSSCFNGSCVPYLSIGALTLKISVLLSGVSFGIFRQNFKPHLYIILMRHLQSSSSVIIIHHLFKRAARQPYGCFVNPFHTQFPVPSRIESLFWWLKPRSWHTSDSPANLLLIYASCDRRKLTPEIMTPEIMTPRAHAYSMHANFSRCGLYARTQAAKKSLEERNHFYLYAWIIMGKNNLWIIYNWEVHVDSTQQVEGWKLFLKYL